MPPVCPLCRTNSLVRYRTGYDGGNPRYFGVDAASPYGATLEIPPEIPVPECGRCFKRIVSHAMRIQLWRAEEFVLRRCLPR